jgi:hypothetical protein
VRLVDDGVVDAHIKDGAAGDAVRVTPERDANLLEDALPWVEAARRGGFGRAFGSTAAARPLPCGRTERTP